MEGQGVFDELGAKNKQSTFIDGVLRGGMVIGQGLTRKGIDGEFQLPTMLGSGIHIGVVSGVLSSILPEQLPFLISIPGVAVSEILIGFFMSRESDVETEQPPVPGRGNQHASHSATGTLTADMMQAMYNVDNYHITQETSQHTVKSQGKALLDHDKKHNDPTTKKNQTPQMTVPEVPKKKKPQDYKVDHDPTFGDSNQIYIG